MSIIVLLKKTPKCIENFINYFENLENNQHQIKLSSFYEDSIEFQDPIHQIKSITAVSSYFDKNKNLKSGGFVFNSISIDENKCFLEWTMDVELNIPSKRITATGISVLSFENKIIYHRDYFDAGELFYENIPLVGSIIRLIKNKLMRH